MSVEGELLSAVWARIEQLLEAETDHADVLISPRDKWTARFQSFVAARALEESLLDPNGVVKFSDPGDLAAWIKAFVVAFIERKLEWHTHPFLPLPTTSERAENAELRIALFSDWGTGRYGAPRIRKAIEADGRFSHVIHLGDTYYTGEPAEISNYLLGDWPQVDGAVSRALNGNHEMYSGGRGYFEQALPALNQSSSVFAIENDDWLIAGLDSAYEDWDLASNQADWLAQLVAAAGTKRLIVLTHHQPYSNTASEQGPRLQAKLASLLQEKRIFAWYWGHEHICAIYEQHPIWDLYGRCIGNGGMPEKRHRYSSNPAETVEGVSFYPVAPRGANPTCLALDGPNPYIPGRQDEYTAHGYLTLDLSASGMIETYRDADGHPLKTITLP